MNQAYESLPEVNWEDYFIYDPSSPTFLINKVKRCNRAKKGEPAGCVGKKEIKTRFGYKYYRNAKIIWEMHHGAIPEDKLLRFKDGNDFNLLISNLELQTRREKGLRKVQKVGKSGERGIYLIKNAYMVQIKYKGEAIYFGSYPTLEEAIVVRNRALKLTK